MSFDFSTLITDRQKSDADYARALIGKITDGTATAEELAEWNAATLKGVYDYTDLNRVTAAMDEINSLLSAAGYKTGYQPVEVHPSDIDTKTLLLLHGDELKDSSMYAVPLTNRGVQESTVQSKFGGKSLYFNGQSFLKAKLVSSGDMTVDFWYYQGSFTTSYPTPFDWVINNTRGNLVHMASPMSYQISVLNGNQNNGTFDPPPLNRWNHIAVVRSGINQYCFVNGILKSTINNVNLENDYIIIGYDGFDMNGCPFTGYIDEFRISNVARWSSNFSPPDHAYGLSEKEPYTWYESDNPTLPQLTQYLTNVRALRSTIANQSPDVPGMKDMFSVEAANNIEKILLSIEYAIQIMKQTYVPCGATACGGDYL